MQRFLSLFFVTGFLAGAGLAQAATESVTDQNASLTFVTSDPFNINAPTDPVSIPQRLEWVVDGRKIVVYPSNPLVYLDFSDHLHDSGHVGSHQIHAQGPMLGYATGVTGGVVYSVVGDASGSGISRISEKVDIRNTTNEAISLTVVGMGWKPTGGAHQRNLEVPDLSGLNVRGTTLVFIQGQGQATSIIDSPFAPVTVFPATTFSGFNTQTQKISLAAGATMTLITEINVGDPPPPAGGDNVSAETSEGGGAINNPFGS